jgi:hypothetical protein
MSRLPGGILEPLADAGIRELIAEVLRETKCRFWKCFRIAD